MSADSLKLTRSPRTVWVIGTFWRKWGQGLGGVGEGTFDHAYSAWVHGNSGGILGASLIGSEIPLLIPTAPVPHRILLKRHLDQLHERAVQDMHTLDILLRLQVGFDLNHGVFRRKIAELELRVIQRPVRGDVARDFFRLCGVDEDLLALHHEVVGAQVGADDDVAALDGFSSGGGVVAGALQDGDARV